MTLCEHLQAAYDKAIADDHAIAAEAILALMEKIGCPSDVHTDGGGNGNHV